MQRLTICQWWYHHERIKNYYFWNPTKIILDQLHYSHQSVEKTCLSATDAVYWERINADIENMIKNCLICQENLLAQPKETL